DMRFDVPVVGLQTIEVMRRSHATALAIDAARTLLFDRDDLIRAADEAGIAIEAFAPAEAAAPPNKSESQTNREAKNPSALLSSAPESSAATTSACGANSKAL